MEKYATNHTESVPSKDYQILLNTATIMDTVG